MLRSIKMFAKNLNHNKFQVNYYNFHYMRQTTFPMASRAFFLIVRVLDTALFLHCFPFFNKTFCNINSKAHITTNQNNDLLRVASLVVF
mmetsp:Transcript_33180/g.40147  ORF Transcript_33180/g.40147 Transcript_33180/m.40147 type:complete len:89 (+) Transcript_33180:98-364(+)